MSKRNVVLIAAAFTAASLSHSAFASPYAAQITEAGGVVSYTLSEDADEVIIIRDGTATSVGAKSIGANTFTRDGAAVFQIIAKKNTATNALGYMNVKDNNAGLAPTSNGINGPIASVLEIGNAETGTSQKFELPKAIAINTNPATPSLFGRAYVAQSRNSPTASRGTEGIYILNADRTAALGTETTARTAGITFDANGSSLNSTGGTVVIYNTTDLNKISLDAEGNLYVADYALAATSSPSPNSRASVALIRMSRRSPKRSTASTPTRRRRPPSARRSTTAVSPASLSPALPPRAI